MRERRRGRAVLAEHGAKRANLDRIAERGAGAVRLDVIHVRSRHARFRQHFAQQRLLRRTIRDSQSAARSILVDRRSRE